MKSPALSPRHRTPKTLRSTVRSLLPALGITLLFVGVGVVHVTSRVLVVSSGYQLSRLEASHRALAMENDRLRLERATLRHPARLERYARGRLGMAPPAPASVLRPARLETDAPNAAQTLARAPLTRER